MRTFRLLFFDDGIICGRFVFQSDDDNRADQIGETLFDACSDRCQSWGIWEGREFVSSGPRKLGPRLRSSDLAEHWQENIAQCLETILNSEWAVASSKRLLAELEKLKACKKGASSMTAPVRFYTNYNIDRSIVLLDRAANDKDRPRYQSLLVPSDNLLPVMNKRTVWWNLCAAAGALLAFAVALRVAMALIV